jgi:predicted dehydrogenase/threonine dehydrogenase-like Zn-dependent dehydrogenase
MKQIIQSLQTGETSLVEVPLAQVQEGHLLIQTYNSLVSTGTEKMLLEFGKANWLNKARQQPERVKAVFNKIKTDGLKPTIEAVSSKLKQAIPLGYSNAGIVLAVGKNVQGFSVGDRVASNGQHAEIVHVPQHLAAKIPDNVSFESAAFTVVGAIALQGIRLAQPSFGETFVVYGLGLIGQITAQLLLANGCKVIGIDKDEQKCIAARALGIDALCNEQNENIAAPVLSYTKQIGADAVIITASTKDQHIIADAAQMSRKRGRIILIGVVGLQLNRTDFYEKELSFQVSCSYGPGRYDYQYEQKSEDYPIGFVRWTAQRNFEAILQALSTQQLQIDKLIKQRIPFESFANIYAHLDDEAYNCCVFSYNTEQTHCATIHYNKAIQAIGNGQVGIIGAGNFVQNVILPQLKKHKLPIKTIISAQGLHAAQMAQQFGIPTASSDEQTIWQDQQIKHVIIATRHDSHAELCIQALQAGKHVFIEKPLAISAEAIAAIEAQSGKSNHIINIGYNRRHAPLAQKIKTLIGDASSELNIVMTINAGTIDPQHWLNDTAKSGGRIIGEICHFIDLATYWCTAPVVSVCCQAHTQRADDITLLLQFKNGATASIHYFTNGHKRYDKERFELYTQGKTLVLENWKKLSAYGFKHFTTQSSSQDKGHQQQFTLLAAQIKQGGKALIPFESIINTSKASIAALESIRTKSWVQL